MSTYCPRCGNEVTGGHFCTVCGAKMERTATDQGYVAPCPPPTVSPTAPTAAAGSKFPIAAWIGIGAAVLAIVVAAIISSAQNHNPNFQELYEQYCHHVWADVGSDNSYLRIDTNPQDIEDRGIAYRESYEALEEINLALGLPAYLFEDFGETTAADGLQEYTSDHIRVTWKYHPDRGLEVTYRAV